jgi:predicted dehydrogenase
MNSPGDQHLTIVIEGIGDVVQRNYAPALKIEKDRYGDRLTVIFVDFGRGRSEEAIKRYQKFIDALDGWATYINKATPEGEKIYNTLQPDVVFIATPDRTHVDLALKWLDGENDCEHLFVEKPLDSSIDKARALGLYIEGRPFDVHALDHYLARFIPISYPSSMKAILTELGGSIKHLSFYLLEDHSAPFAGPIEKEGRSGSLQNGLILDLFPHALAILGYFGSVSSIKINGLTVGRYTYENENKEVVPASIPRETFGHISFTFTGRAGRQISADAYVGKGISGSTKAAMENGDVKLLELVGKNGKKCSFDLRNTSRGGKGTIKIVGRDGKSEIINELLDEPYAVLINRTVDKYLKSPEKDLRFSLTVDQAKNILTCIQEITSLVSLFEKTGTELPSYKIKTITDGAKPVSVAPTLEEINAELKDIRENISIDKLLAYYESAQAN